MFRDSLGPSVSKPYVLTMLFLKYVSDVWQDGQALGYNGQGDRPEQGSELDPVRGLRLPHEATFDALLAKRDNKGNGQRIDEALRAIEHANQDEWSDVFADIRFNSDKLGDEAKRDDILRHFLEAFADLNLELDLSRRYTPDVIGEAYELLLKSFALATRKKEDGIYPPAEIAQLVASIVAPQAGDEICDPVCGTGSLLLACEHFGRPQHEKMRNARLSGQEASRTRWALAKINMFLHGKNSRGIVLGDVIESPKLLNPDRSLKRFDVLVANLLFSQEQWAFESAEHDPYGRFRRGLPPRSRDDYAIILHMVETMKPEKGRMAVIAPHGVLFRGAAEGEIRRKLIKENLLGAVIGLPEKLFHGINIPAAVLIFQSSKTDDTVLFIDASRDFEPGKNLNMLRDVDLQRILGAYQVRKSEHKFAHLASLAEIERNDFNLNIPRYIDPFEEQGEVNLEVIKREQEEIRTNLLLLGTQIDNYLAQLGFPQLPGAA